MTNLSENLKRIDTMLNNINKVDNFEMALLIQEILKDNNNICDINYLNLSRIDKKALIEYLIQLKNIITYNIKSSLLGQIQLIPKVMLMNSFYSNVKDDINAIIVVIPARSQVEIVTIPANIKNVYPNICNTIRLTSKKQIIHSYDIISIYIRFILNNNIIADDTIVLYILGCIKDILNRMINNSTIFFESNAEIVEKVCNLIKVRFNKKEYMDNISYMEYYRHDYYCIANTEDIKINALKSFVKNLDYIIKTENSYLKQRDT